MKQRGKLLIILIIAGALVLALASCQQEGAGQENSSPSEQSQTEQTTSDAGAASSAATGSAGGETAATASPAPVTPNSGGSTSGDIGMDRAKAIALAKVPGATEANIVEMEYEYDNGRPEYEGEIYYNGYEYEFEIDGVTGNILQWEIEIAD